MNALVLPLLLAAAPALAGGAGDARRHYGAGREAEAREALAAAVRADPADEEAYSFLLEILPDSSPAVASLGEAARKNLKKGLKKPVYLLALCKSLRAAGEKEKAGAACRSALELDPVFSASYRELALTHEAAGDERRALETAAQWTEISGDYKAWTELGRLRSVYGDFAGARTALARASALAGKSKDPEAPAWRRRAAALTASLARAERKSPSRRGTGPGRKKAEDCAALAAAHNAAGRQREAEETASACLRSAPGHPGLTETLADAYFELGYYEKALELYAGAAEAAGRDRALAGRALRKKAGIHLRMGAGDQARTSYEAALRAYPGDPLLLRELAGFREKNGDHAGAFDLYSRLLKLRPGDKEAAEKLAELEVPAMSPAGLAAELRAREAFPEDGSEAGAEERELLMAMREAEAGGAVDYLKGKLGRLNGLTVERTGPDGSLRLALTRRGYEAWLAARTRDAVGFFERKGMDFRHIFALRDREGAPFFDKKGGLTRRGASAYLKALRGATSWLLPYEDVPDSPAVEKAKAETGALLSGGYEEISEPEYLWLLKKTECPPEVMVEPPIFMKEVRTPARVRYYICRYCIGRNRISDQIAHNIEDYRAGNTEIQSTGGTAFFGRGGSAPPKLCVNGRLSE
ncbi:MAG TPA: tetratricopeptide repeat protein [Elusimicrobiales bacterium]|nr:tetratricopeptide repeat protein [Elusimicrobiales bacterium]